MTEVVYNQADGDPIVVNLRDPYWAALLAWIWPGAGHFYQRRFAKGFLFMICVLSTFLIGLGIGGNGRVVYASFEQGDFRWQYICQVGVGLPALPAVVQSLKTKDGADPYLILCERYPETANPKNQFKIIPPGSDYKGDTLKDGFMAPPAGPIRLDTNDVLGQWHSEFKAGYEMGTLYTVVAGLLNLLVIYDAFCGPSIITPEQRAKMEAKKKKKKKKSDTVPVEEEST